MKKRRPSISIVIPVYNEEKNIKRCLDSIKAQNYKGVIKVFVVDNGCQDKTIEIAKKYSFVKVIKNTVNDYLIAKMLGLKAGKTKYYTYLDADIDLPTKDWIEKMITPLEEDPLLTASFTKFVSYKSDPSLNKYLTLDPIQRDPLFVYLTASPESVTTEKLKDYDILEYKKDKIVPMGCCCYRIQLLLSIPQIANNKKFHELDALVILYNKGHRRYAYVKDAGMHHLTAPDVTTMIKKRVRNLRKTFFVKGEKRYWTWVDFSTRSSVVKLAIWVLYAETIFLPTLYGIFRTIKHRTWLGLYEPLIVWLTTNAIIYVFITSSDGRKFLSKLIK